jgi:CDP-glycerol glycerophosphotransferase (TagB/SpsB family)
MAYSRSNYHDPFGGTRLYYADLLARQKRIYLGHGIVKSDLSESLNQYVNAFDLVIASSRSELEAFRDTPRYGFRLEELALTGRPRYDFLEDRAEKIVVVAPTWRRNLFGTIGGADPRRYLELDAAAFESSEFVHFWRALLGSPALLDAADRLGYRIQFLPHPRFFPYLDRFRLDSRVVILGLDTRYREIFAKGALMVTDWSSAVFDFAYLRKPVLYARFDDPDNYGTVSFDDERDGFGEIEQTRDGIVSRIVEYMAGGCRMKPFFRDRVERFFAFSDRENSRRVYDAILSRG